MRKIAKCEWCKEKYDRTKIFHKCFLMKVECNYSEIDGLEKKLDGYKEELLILADELNIVVEKWKEKNGWK
jgi:hypothetical protein